MLKNNTHNVGEVTNLADVFYMKKRFANVMSAKRFFTERATMNLKILRGSILKSEILEI